MEHPATRWLVYGISPFAVKLSGDPPPVRHVPAEEGGWALALRKAAQYRNGQGEVLGSTSDPHIPGPNGEMFKAVKDEHGDDKHVRVGVPFRSLDHSTERTAKRMHRVFFDLYALDLSPDAIPPNQSWESVAPLIRGHVVDRDASSGLCLDP